MPGLLPALRTALPLQRRRTKVAPLTEEKVVLGAYYQALTNAGWTPWRRKTWPVERAVAEGYETAVWVYKAVEAVAGHASRLPFKLKEGEREVDDHPLYRLLNQKANPLETGRQFRKRLSAQVLLSKRGAFIEVTRSRAGTPVRLDLLPPGRTRPVPGDGDQLVKHYELVRADGTKRQIDPANVRWLREPHPLDPYSGVTPLEAAGMSVELDYFARLYNVTFLRNDGRPGGVLAVNGDIAEVEMNRIESRFSADGPQGAGKLSVIQGELSYVDLAARPRDMAYQVTARTAKQEVLCAFGTPESVLGYAADRTFDNAEQELYNFWSVTMPPHLDLLATGFDEDSEDQLVGYLDTSEVEVLQRAAAARREEARKEFELGLISIDEYRERAGLDPVGNPESRALYVANAGKTVVPANDKDRKALDAAKQPAALPPGGAAPQGPPAPPGQSPPSLPPGPPPDAQPDAGGTGGAEGKAPGPATRGGAYRTGSRPVLRLIRAAAETKAAPPVESHPDEDAQRRLEQALAAALTALTVRLVERTAARLASPKTRKHTRHWVPEHKADTRAGDTAVDAADVVDEGRWQAEAERAARPLIEAAATGAAAGLLTDLGVTATTGATTAAASAAAAATAEVVAMVGAAFAAQATRLVALINNADQDGEPITGIAGQLRARAAHLAGWAGHLAADVAGATVNGARDAAAQAAADAGHPITRTWLTRRDGKVRRTHKAADGQTQDAGKPFVVGGALLRYPGDPAAPPGEAINCRCRLIHRARASGRFVPRPAGKTLPATGTGGD